MNNALDTNMFLTRYSTVFDGDDQWQNLPIPEGNLYNWDPDSSYIQELPIFQDLPLEPLEVQDILGARALAVLGDSITTDHISPAGNIAVDSPAGKYLTATGAKPRDFNTYGARRGNHQVLIRGTFGNIRLRNQLLPDSEGPWTVLLPTKEPMTIYDASTQYQNQGVPLLILAGKEYGAGSSRDWAAKGPQLLGVKVTLAESYERIHRSNLVGMGVLPLQFKPGQNRTSLGLTGLETFDFHGIDQGPKPGQEVTIHANRSDGSNVTFTAIARIDIPIEVEYYRHGGVLQYVLRRVLKENGIGSTT